MFRLGNQIFKFNPDGTGQVITVINQWQDGKQVLVWPADQTSIKVSYPAKPWKERLPTRGRFSSGSTPTLRRPPKT